MPRDRWLLASLVTGKVVGRNDPYPHVCGIDVIGYTGTQFRTSKTQCAACPPLRAVRQRG